MATHSNVLFYTEDWLFASTVVFALSRRGAMPTVVDDFLEALNRISSRSGTDHRVDLLIVDTRRDPIAAQRLMMAARNLATGLPVVALVRDDESAPGEPRSAADGIVLLDVRTKPADLAEAVKRLCPSVLADPSGQVVDDRRSRRQARA